MDELRRKLLQGAAAGAVTGASSFIPMFSAVAQTATATGTSVIVIGAGVAGLAAARRLTREGFAFHNK